MQNGSPPLITLSGTPYERGLSHGRQLADQIGALLGRWGDALTASSGLSRPDYVRRFHEDTQYEATTRDVAPWILEEIEGIAQGSGAAYRDLLVFQHVNEGFRLAGQYGNADNAEETEACSAIAVPPANEKPGLIGHNLDLGAYLNGYQTLFRFGCNRTDGEITTLSVPGMISLIGMNSHGLAICDNSLGQLRPDPEGVPVYVLYRLLLECASLRAATALIRQTDHAACVNWVIGDRAGVAMIERSGKETEAYLTPSRPQIACHTNHPLRCDDWAIDPTSAESCPAAQRSSFLRMAAIERRMLGHQAGQIDATDLMATLSARDDPDYPVSRGGEESLSDIGFTFASSIFEFGEHDTVWHLAPGPGHKTAFQVVNKKVDDRNFSIGTWTV